MSSFAMFKSGKRRNKSAKIHNPPQALHCDRRGSVEVDKPTHPEATPICTSFIRLFVVFTPYPQGIRGRFSPTDMPAETHNPPHGQAHPVRIFSMDYLNSCKNRTMFINSSAEMLSSNFVTRRFNSPCGISLETTIP
jgi:hypothetical protein